MVHAIEFHGRLCRADGRPANPGSYDLAFGLHTSREGSTTLWEDEVHGVPVAAGGYYHTVLGTGNALRPHLFDGSPRYLSVRVVREGRKDEELSERVPVLGVLLTVAESVRALDARVSLLEAGGEDPGANLVTRRMRSLRRRLRRLEAGEGALAPVLARLASIETRLARLDGQEGRVTRIEDELEDIVGPDGDIVDLTERMDAIEKGIARLAR